MTQDVTPRRNRRGKQATQWRVAEVWQDVKQASERCVMRAAAKNGAKTQLENDVIWGQLVCKNSGLLTTKALQALLQENL